jgi:hypothetical protein
VERAIAKMELMIRAMGKLLGGMMWLAMDGPWNWSLENRTRRISFLLIGRVVVDWEWGGE